MADTGAVADIVRAAIAANPKAVADYKNGKAAAANAIKGAIMRQTKGSVRIDVVERVPHRFPANTHNALYLATKRSRTGHLD